MCTSVRPHIPLEYGQRRVGWPEAEVTQEDGHLLQRRQVGPAEAVAARLDLKVGGQDPVSTFTAASISEAQNQAPTIAALG